MRKTSLSIALSLALCTAACGKKPDPAPVADTTTASADTTAPAAPTPDATPAPAPDTTAPAPASDVAAAPAPDVAAAPAPAPDVAAAPASTSLGFLAWTEGDDDVATATLLVPKDDGSVTEVARKTGDLIVAFEGKVWKLGREASKMPLKPCGEDGEALYLDLTVTPLVPAGDKKVYPLSDPKTHPKAGESAIHNERISFVAQLGPFVYLHHEANSDVCPVPAGGAVYDTYRVLDLRDGSLRAPLDLYTEAERATVDKAALEAAVPKIKEGFPDAPVAEIAKVVRIFGAEWKWNDEGRFVLEIVVVGKSKLFSEMVDEEESTSADVPASALPAALSGFDTTAPAPALSAWKASGHEHRGFIKLEGAAFDATRRAFE